MNTFFVTLIVNILGWYQRVASKRLRACCRYEPSCSEFMILAVHKYGPLVGLWRGVLRLLRCRPPLGGADYP
ncbi:MAG: membrane protein insertion efficiency factor YidD [Gammaproteobacteria bacterium]